MKFKNCLMDTKNGCGKPNCKNCGFDREEAERRKPLPLVTGTREIELKGNSEAPKKIIMPNVRFKRVGKNEE